MDKNIAAFIRDNSKTIGVRFFKDNQELVNGKNTILNIQDKDKSFRTSDKEYTYVTMEDYEVGDLAVVIVSEVPKIVVVTRVDESLEITPNDDVHYKWVVCKVSMANYHKVMEENAVLTKTVAKSYQRNIKNSFRNIMLGALGEAEQTQILAITSPSLAKEETK